ncbi:MAG TPA: protoporphyrinogen oxidase [Acidisarcina sp.]|nr:protoporphyrinogen oxidase [Acidisarcina sp.]
MKVAIVGGGISGLSAAFEIEKSRAAKPNVEYVLLEKSPRLGGSVFSEWVDGCLVEGGPDSFMTEKVSATKLCADLGIADHLVGSNDSARKTYILLKNRLIALPDGLMFLVPTKLIPTALTPLFTWKTKIRMGLELLAPPRPMHGDESVAALVERHFGAEAVDRLADPLLSGIYGGDASILSARTVLPKLVEMEEKYGSLTRGMLAAYGKQTPKPNASSKPRGSIFSSLRGGMQELVSGIESRLNPSSIRKSTTVSRIERTADGWQLIIDGEPQQFDALVVATQAWAAGSLLAGVDAQLGKDLGDIPYSSSITVTLGYAETDLASSPDGFGFLIPASENRSMLACTFVHRKFPNRTPDGIGLLRCFLGGARNSALLDESDEQLESRVRTELKEILGLTANPRFVRIHRWRKAMAQYSVGHQERMDRISQAVARQPRLALAGNAYLGIGVPDCIRTGQAAAASILETA